MTRGIESRRPIWSVALQPVDLDLPSAVPEVCQDRALPHLSQASDHCTRHIAGAQSVAQRVGLREIPEPR